MCSHVRSKGVLYQTKFFLNFTEKVAASLSVPPSWMFDIFHSDKTTSLPTKPVLEPVRNSQIFFFGGKVEKSFVSGKAKQKRYELQERYWNFLPRDRRGKTKIAKHRDFLATVDGKRNVFLRHQEKCHCKCHRSPHPLTFLPYIDSAMPTILVLLFFVSSLSWLKRLQENPEFRQLTPEKEKLHHDGLESS